MKPPVLLAGLLTLALGCRFDGNGIDTLDAGIRAWGGQFVVPIPRVTVYP